MATGRQPAGASGPTVLFLQTNPTFTADAQVHAAIARHLPSLGLGAVAACQPSTPEWRSTTIERFRELGKVDVIACRFGARRISRSPAALARAVLVDVPAAAIDLGRLVIGARRRRVDVVHCTEKVRESLTAYAIARLAGTRLTVHLHVDVAPWFHRWTLRVMHRADRLVAISESVRSSALAAGFPAEKVSVALNALAPQTDVELLSPHDRASVRAELGVPEDTQLVAIVARLNPWKGHRQLLAAVSGLAPHLPDVRLLVVGEGDQRAAFESFAADLGIADRVHFLGFRQDALRLIHASDVFAMPSSGEPFGLVYLEAMRCGVPVVALDDGGTPEVVDDGVTGLLSPPGDAAMFTSNLRRLLEDSDLRARLGAAGRDVVERRFRPERMAADFAAIIRSVTEEPSGRRGLVDRLRLPKASPRRR